MIIQTDIFKMSILHAKPSGNGPKFRKSQAFIQMPGMDIAFNDCIKLNHPETKFLYNLLIARSKKP